MKWRPIKTAPRDKAILLSYPNGEKSYVCQGRWVEQPHTNQVMRLIEKGEEIGAVDPHWEIGYIAIMEMGGRWNGLTWNARSYCVHPTHWQPLPEPKR